MLLVLLVFPRAIDIISSTQMDAPGIKIYAILKLYPYRILGHDPYSMLDPLTEILTN